MAYARKLLRKRKPTKPYRKTSRASVVSAPLRRGVGTTKESIKELAKFRKKKIRTKRKAGLLTAAQKRAKLKATRKAKRTGLKKIRTATRAKRKIKRGIRKTRRTNKRVIKKTIKGMRKARR